MYNIFKFNYNNKETYNINKLSETALIKFPCFLGEFFNFRILLNVLRILKTAASTFFGRLVKITWNKYL